MMRFQLALTALTLVVPSFAPRAFFVGPPVDQDCGTTVFGGIMGPGNYAGAGSSCAAAQDDLEGDMGMTKPDCDDCPPNERGCTPKCVPDDSGGSITWGNCYFDEVTGLYVKPATASASTSWDKVCTSCKPVLPH